MTIIVKSVYMKPALNNMFAKISNLPNNKVKYSMFTNYEKP